MYWLWLGMWMLVWMWFWMLLRSLDGSARWCAMLRLGWRRQGRVGWGGSFVRVAAADGGYLVWAYGLLRFVGLLLCWVVRVCDIFFLFFPFFWGRKALTDKWRRHEQFGPSIGIGCRDNECCLARHAELALGPFQPSEHGKWFTSVLTVVTGRGVRGFKRGLDKTFYCL